MPRKSYEGNTGTGPVVLLTFDSQGAPVAIGPFANQRAAQRWEDRNPQRSEDVQGMARLVGSAGDIDGVLDRG